MKGTVFVMQDVTRYTRTKAWLVPVCVVILGLAGPAVLADDTPDAEEHHEEFRTHFKIFAAAGYVAPMSDGPLTFATFEDNVELQKEVGWDFGIEGRFGKLIGIELDYLQAKQDVAFGGTTIGTTDFSPLTATLNFHLIHTKIVDFYIGPSYSYVNWGTIKLNADGEAFFSTQGLETDSSHGWGASAGLDIGLGKHFFLTGGLRYLNVALETNTGESSDVDPLIGRLGLGVRF
jgi:outer membrane protein W